MCARFDMHVHSKYSGDSQLEPSEIARACVKKGLDGVAVTDHNTIRGAIETKRAAKGLDVMIGAEIMTDRGEVMGHMLNEEIKSRELGEVIDEIKAQGGIVSVPHPFDTLRRSSTLERDALESVAKRLDCVEGVNGRAFWHFNRRAQAFAREHSLRMIAGSDAHTASEIGRCVTVFSDAERFEVEGVSGPANVIFPAVLLARTKFYKIFGI